MSYQIRKVGTKFCVEDTQTGRKLSVHATKLDAESQMKTLSSGVLEISPEQKGVERHLHLVAATTVVRTEQLNGREHLVVPVVALVEGVIWPVNAPKPELATAESFSTAPQTWNGRPVFCGHPQRNGSQVSGNRPDILEESIGQIFGARVDGKRLLMEAWIDSERAQLLEDGRQLLKRLEAGDTIEVSVGAFVTTASESGAFNGREYAGVWQAVYPDHLAMLADDEVGACSVSAGCGAPRIAQAYLVTAEGLDELEEVEVDGDLIFCRKISQAERDKIPAKDFAGPDRSFFIQKPEDVRAAVRSIGRTKHNRDAIKKKIISIAYRKGPRFVTQLPNDWKRKSDQRSNEGRSMWHRMLEAFRSAMQVDDMSDLDVRKSLMDALQEKYSNGCYIEAVYPDYVVYSTYETAAGNGSGDMCTYQAAYTLEDGRAVVSDTRVSVRPVLTYEPEVELVDAKGARHSNTDMKRIQAMHDHAVELGAVCSPTTASQHKPCKCQENHDNKGDTMKPKAERITALIENHKTVFSEADRKMLEEASEERITAFETAAKGDLVKAIIDKIIANPDLPFSEDDRAMLEKVDEARLLEWLDWAPGGNKSGSQDGDGQDQEDKKDQNKDGAGGSGDNSGDNSNSGDQKNMSGNKEEVKQLTEEEYLAQAPESIRTLVAEKKAQDVARKTELVSALKTAQSEYKEEELNAMDLKTLERNAKMLKVGEPKVNFGALGAHRVEIPKAAPEPIDMTARLRASRGQQQQKAS